MAHTASTKSEKATLAARRTGCYIALVLISFLCLFFFYVLVINSTRTHFEIQKGFSLLPGKSLMTNLKNVLNDANIPVLTGVRNSLIVSACSAALSVYFSALTAYGIYAYNFRFKKAAFAIILLIMTMPTQVSALGFLQLITKMGLKNSFLPLIIPSIAAPAVFFFMKQYLDASLPMEIVEAARIDGAGEFYTFNKIVLPIMKPALAVQAIITLSAILIPAFWPYSYDQQLGVRPGKPVDASFNNLAPFEYGKTELKRIEEGEKVFPHVFGTDSAGRDYFIRVVYGTRISLAVGFFASLIVLIIGMTVGSIAGYCGGKVDLIIMRIVDIIYSLPDTLMVILLATVLKVSIGDKLDGTPLAKIGSNIISLFIVFAVLYWVSMARLIRGQILSLREQEYVLAAQATGAKGRWIITRHLVPNCMSVIFISTALQIPNAIFTESFLSYLGLGVNAPMPSLGSLASDALNGLTSYPYRMVIPALVISLIVLSLNLFGDGLRDAFDPKLNG